MCSTRCTNITQLTPFSLRMIRCRSCLWNCGRRCSRLSPFPKRCAAAAADAAARSPCSPLGSIVLSYSWTGGLQLTTTLCDSCGRLAGTCDLRLCRDRGQGHRICARFHAVRNVNNKKDCLQRAASSTVNNCISQLEIGKANSTLCLLSSACVLLRDKKTSGKTFDHNIRWAKRLIRSNLFLCAIYQSISSSGLRNQITVHRVNK
jgi:hypothetical protein